MQHEYEKIRAEIRGGKNKKLNLLVKIDQGTILVYHVRERAVRVVFLIIHI